MQRVQRLCLKCPSCLLRVGRFLDRASKGLMGGFQERARAQHESRACIAWTLLFLLCCCARVIIAYCTTSHAARWVPVPQACMRRAGAGVQPKCVRTGLLALGKHAPVTPPACGHLVYPQCPGSAGINSFRKYSWEDKNGHGTTLCIGAFALCRLVA